MTKSELIAHLQASIAEHGDGPVYHDLDVGDDIIEITQVDHIEITLFAGNNAQMQGLPAGGMVLL